MEGKENERFILYLEVEKTVEGDVHTLPGKEWFLSKTNVLLMNVFPSFSEYHKFWDMPLVSLGQLPCLCPLPNCCWL